MQMKSITVVLKGQAETPVFAPSLSSREMISPLVTSRPCRAPPALGEPHVFFVPCLSYLFK